MAYLDGLGQRETPQLIGNLRGDIKIFATGDFETNLRTLYMYDGNMKEGWGSVVRKFKSPWY